MLPVSPGHLALAWQLRSSRPPENGCLLAAKHARQSKSGVELESSTPPEELANAGTNALFIFVVETQIVEIDIDFVFQVGNVVDVSDEIIELFGSSFFDRR